MSMQQTPTLDETRHGTPRRMTPVTGTARGTPPPLSNDYRTFRFSNGVAWMAFIDACWDNIVTAHSLVEYDTRGNGCQTWVVHMGRPNSGRDRPSSVKVRFSSISDLQGFIETFWDRIGQIVDHNTAVGGLLIGSSKQADTSYFTLDLLPPVASPLAATADTALDKVLTTRTQ